MLPQKPYPVTILRQLSYSSLLALHGCPRKYLLNKSLVPNYVAASSSTATVDMTGLGEFIGLDVTPPKKELTEAQKKQAVTFAFGKAVGVGVQSVMQGKDFDAVLVDMFLEWDTWLLDEDERMRKSFWDAISAVESFAALSTLDFDITDYELVKVPGTEKWAVEMSFVILLPGGARYRGYIDAVIRNKYTGEIVVLECKTTGSTFVSAAKYQNSEQALGYALILDKVFGQLSSYSVLYTVYLTKSSKWEVFKFPKTSTQRASWFLNTMSDLEHLEGYIANEYFPNRGENCEAWGRPCDYIDICCSPELRNFFREDGATDKDEDFDYVITLEELMGAQGS